MVREMLKQAAVLFALTGCWSDGATVPLSPASKPAPVAREAVVPSVRMMSQAEWDACKDCDEQSLEGGAPLRYKHFPAVSADGAVIAVVEERDGWGHTSVPGVRLLDRNGATLKRLALGGDRGAAEPLVAQANAALGAYTWLPVEMPPVKHREVSDTESESRLVLADFAVTYNQRSNGDYSRPPYRIKVTTHDGRVINERNVETEWSHEPGCNLPAFEFVGGNATARVVLFKTGLGMGGHNCDGVEQPPAWHILAY